jgi:hypothetical protein
MKRSSKFYQKLITHCNKQYKNISVIERAYLINNKVYAVDYICTNNIVHIASNTAICEKTINFI